MHFRDFRLLSSQQGEESNPDFELTGRAEGRSSSGFRAELASGRTCSSGNRSCCVFPLRARACLETFLRSLVTPHWSQQALGPATARDYRSAWRRLKQTGVKTEVEVEATQVSGNKCLDEQSVVCTFNEIIIPSQKRGKFRHRLQHGRTLALC